MPPPIIVDGLLGLDFFHLQVLTLNFRKGEISCANRTAALLSL